MEDSVGRLLAPLAVMLLALGGCRADLGRALPSTEPEVAPATGGTFAARMRSRWAQTAVTPARAVASRAVEESSMDALRGADAQTREQARRCSSLVVCAETDRMAEAFQRWGPQYCVPHCD